MNNAKNNISVSVSNNNNDNNNNKNIKNNLGLLGILNVGY